jgi:hypothetical protein
VLSAAVRNGKAASPHLREQMEIAIARNMSSISYVDRDAIHTFSQP